MLGRMLSSPPTLQSSIYQRYVNSIGAIDQSGCAGGGGGGANAQRPRAAIFGHKHVIYLLNMIGFLACSFVGSCADARPSSRSSCMLVGGVVW